MNTHQQLRANLWCNVATGIAVIPTIVKKETPAKWADHILEDFDKRFPEEGPVDVDPEVAALRKKYEELSAYNDKLRVERDTMSDDLETERMRLVAVGVVACADTPESAASARQMHPDYRSASLHDVERRVDECIALRAERDALLRWKEEMLEVNRRWNAVDEFVRSHPSMVIGKFIDSEAIRLMRERDLYRAQLLSHNLTPMPLP